MKMLTTDPNGTEGQEFVDAWSTLDGDVHRSSDETVGLSWGAGDRGAWVFAGRSLVGFCSYVHDRVDALTRMPRNWDQYGAPPINPDIAQAAKDLAGRLPEERTPRPDVVPLSSGAIQFEWSYGTRELELEIEAADTIHYLKWQPTKGIEEEGVYPIGDLDKTKSLIQWVCHG